MAWLFNLDTVENWAYMDGVFTSEECDKIKRIALAKGKEEATVIGNNKQGKIDKKIRKNSVVWLNEKDKEYDVQILEHFLCISKHRIYKLVNDMIRDGYLKKITTTKEIKDMICTEKETESYLVAIVPSILDDNSDNDSAPF
jgi:hypothetical protein